MLVAWPAGKNADISVTQVPIIRMYRSVNLFSLLGRTVFKLGQFSFNRLAAVFWTKCCSSTAMCSRLNQKITFGSCLLLFESHLKETLQHIKDTATFIILVIVWWRERGGGGVRRS